MFRQAHLIVAPLLALAAGCDKYEYSLQDVAYPSSNTQQAVTRLAKCVLRYGQDTRDPVVIIAGVSLLARNPDTAKHYDLVAMLNQAMRMRPEDPSLELLGDAVGSDIASATAAASDHPNATWPLPPTNIGDRGPALSEPLWDFARLNSDPLSMLAAVQIEAESTPAKQVPARGSPERGKWITGLEQRIATAMESIPANRPELEEIAARLSGELTELGRPVSVRPGEDWPDFLGLKRNGISGEEGIATDWPIPVAWHREVGQGYAMCSVRGSQLYHFDRVGSRSRLTCLDAVTGDQSWTFEYATDYRDLGGYQDGPRCSPLVDGPVNNTRVYLYGAEGMLHCLNAETGDVVWKVNTSEQFGVVPNLYGVAASPLVHGDMLIAVVGGSDSRYLNFPPARLDQVQGNGTGIVAFDKRNGKVVYECSDYLAGYASPILADIHGTAWCFALMREGLVGFDPDTGAVRSQHPFRPRQLSGVSAATPTLTDAGQLLISAAYGLGSELLQITEDGFDPQWSGTKASGEPVLECLFSTPVYHNGYFYACHGQSSQDAELRCLAWNPETRTLEVKWKQPGLTRVSLLCVQDHLVVLTEYGKLLLVKASPERFEKVAEMVLEEEPGSGVPSEFAAPPMLKYPCWAAPILSRGLLYVLGPRRLVCLELIPQRTGSPVSN